MGYFNYFIKCIIRKFVNLMFKPKMLIIFLILICMLFVLQTTSRAEWTDEQIESLQLDLFNIIFELEQQVDSLKSIENKVQNIDYGVSGMYNQLTYINSSLNNIYNDTSNIKTNITNIVNQLTTLNTEIKNIYNKLDENQKELLTELEEDNQAVLEELNMIRDAINGTEEEPTTYTDLGIISSNTTDAYWKLKTISLNYEPRYSYTIKVYYKNQYTGSITARAFYDDNLLPSNYNKDDYTFNTTILGSIPPGSNSYVFSYNVPSTNPKYIYFTWGPSVEKIEVYRSIKGIVESLNDNNSLQQEQNQLQQQQNQLQQEQNDFLKDDNVNSDGLEFATDDTVNPTSEGFNTLFNTIYNTFCNTTSEPLTITLPYINKTFTIQPNIVSNGMQKAGLGVIVGLINSFYYFSVCLFIYKDISKIVDNLKSGNITSDCGNVKTEVL